MFKVIEKHFLPIYCFVISKKSGALTDTRFFLCFYGLLAAAAVVVATATVAYCSVITAAAAAEEDEDEDNNPRTIVTTKITHIRKPP